MIRIAVRVVPNSSKSEIVGQLGSELKIKIQEPADGSRANRALCALIAKLLKIPKNRVSIAVGEKSKQKILMIDCPFSVDQAMSKLLMGDDVGNEKS